MSDASLPLEWTIDGPPVFIPSANTLALGWTIDGPPEPSTILIKAGGELIQQPFLIKAAGELIDPSTFEPWTP